MERSTAAAEHVLVVDDSEQSRLAARAQLEYAGYNVMLAESGEQALEILAKDRVDLVVLDLLMPGIGGYGTCRAIRATPATADLPVMFLSALADRDAVESALDVGGDDLLPKPYHSGQLVMRVRALIRQRKTAEELKQAMRNIAEHNEARRRIEHDKRQISHVVQDVTDLVDAVAASADRVRLTQPAEMAQALEEIAVAAGQLKREMRHLSEWSRAVDGELRPRLESFSLGEVASEVASAMRALARWTGVVLDIDVGNERVVADRELTRRLLQNLVNNAVKHAPHGTIVTIEAAVDADGLVLRVNDCGPGVPARDVERIFERFSALSNTAAPGDDIDADDLGLAFCRIAAEAHGGRIWVEPREGRGTSFCVRIPQPLA